MSIDEHTVQLATPADIIAIRADFPILSIEVNGQPLVYLDNAATSQKPKIVLDAIEHYYTFENSNVHRGVHKLSQLATEAYESARRKVQELLNAEFTEEIIITGGTTDSINLIASSYGKGEIKAGDEIIVSEMEHHSNIVPWQMLCEYSGAKLHVVPFDDKGNLDINKFESLLTDKTKLIAMAHVSNSLGTVNPVKEIIQKAHEKNIPVLLDGAQAVPHMKVDVRDLDCDFYSFSAHKAFGPTGIGALYGKKKLLEKLPPARGGGEMIESVTFEKTTYNSLPHKFEAGTPNIAGAVGMGSAIEYINSISYELISSWEDKLLKYATEKMQLIDGLKVVGEADNKAGVLSFIIEGLHAYDIGTIVDQQGVAVRTGHHCAQPVMDHFNISGTIRASLSVYNTIEDIDRLYEATRKAVSMLR